MPRSRSIFIQSETCLLRALFSPWPLILHPQALNRSRQTARASTCASVVLPASGWETDRQKSAACARPLRRSGERRRRFG